ncbi:hypothetical protein [Kordiimonas pumila]|uniref:Uncharacterized protein n=1 Tax=Kordiimonas pumila TaxID=2161677 RepID=A0ABV7D6S0_9PROT|nr:hypothetical protein [Kordiimonas pumila]
MSAPFLRSLSDQERESLPGDWENLTGIKNPEQLIITLACECDEATYNRWLGPKQIHDHRFIIACTGDLS